MDSIFRDAAVVLMIVNKEGEVVDINKSGEIFSGNKRENLLGLLGGHAINCITATNDDEVVCGNASDCSHCIIRGCVERTLQHNISLYKKEGLMKLERNGETTNVNVLISTTPIDYMGERMVLVTLDDITKQKAVEKQLKDLNVMKDKFFSIIAHDLMHPFNSILGYSELLLKAESEGISADEQHMFVKHLHNSSQQAYTLVEDLLTWARVQTNRLFCNPELLYINELVDTNIKILSLSALKKDIELKNCISEDKLVFVDKFMISTVLRNLMSNAIKFTPLKGSISIEANVINGDKLRISIRDNGVGISDEVIDKLFRIEHFYSSPGTDGEKGTGLGLVMCKEFIEKHNGEIGVDSIYGQGSVFWFTLPMEVCRCQ